MAFSLVKILDWLREGYPQGVPREDYIALFGVLQRHLTEPEIISIGQEIRRANGDGPVSDDEVRRHVEGHLKGHAAEEDVRRVAARLAAGGWPLAAGPATADPATTGAETAGPGTAQ